MNDLKFAIRQLLKNPGFTTVSVLTLALGLALTASTMAVVNAYLIRSMPFPAANRLYRVIYVPNGGPEPRGVAAMDWRSLNDVVEIADYSAGARFYLVQNDTPQEVSGLLAAPASLDALGVRAKIGRSLSPEDFREGAENVVLISHAMWRERFGSDANVIGRHLRATLAITTNLPQPYRIVGVLPPDFRYVREYARAPAEIVVPLHTTRQTYMVRLREGVPAPFAERRITDVLRSAGSAFPPNWRGVALESIHDGYVRELRSVLLAITMAAGFVLVIVAANVAVLTLLRAMRRQKEMAVRVALGASRRHLSRMLLAEAGLICAMALAGGLALTAITLRLLAPSIEARLGRPVPGGLSALHVDPTVLLMVGGATVVIALSLSFVPLLAPWQRRLADALRGDARSGIDRPSTRRVRSSLIALEVAASMALLVGCGLMIRSVVNMMHTDFGYPTSHVLRARIQLPPRSYPDTATFMRFYDRLAERFAVLPNTAFALSDFFPFFENPKQTVQVEDREIHGTRASVLLASEGYFETLGIGLRDGRGFAAGDRAGAEPVAVISETLAAKLWPGEHAVGKRIRTVGQNGGNSPPTAWRTIVGVAKDVRQTFAAEEDRNDIYVPFAQQPTRFASLLIRTDRPQLFWQETLRAAVAEVDPQVIALVTATLTDDIDKQLSMPRFLMSLMTGFATFAAFLATLGIYGVTAYAVQQREREVAIRVALGATNRGVVRLFLKDSGIVLVAGIGLGLFAALAVARILESQIYGVQPFDFLTLLGAGVFMAAAGLLATWWPVRRATLRDPMTVLKEG